MSEHLDDRIIEEAKTSVRNKLLKQEANFLATRIGLAAVEYPNIIAHVLAFVFRDKFQLITEDMLAMQKRIEALEADNKAISDKLDRARQAFADLKKSQTPPPRPQDRGRR